MGKVKTRNSKILKQEKKKKKPNEHASKDNSLNSDLSTLDDDVQKNKFIEQDIYKYEYPVNEIEIKDEIIEINNEFKKSPIKIKIEHEEADVSGKVHDSNSESTIVSEESNDSTVFSTKLLSPKKAKKRKYNRILFYSSSEESTEKPENNSEDRTKKNQFDTHHDTACESCSKKLVKQNDKKMDNVEIAESNKCKNNKTNENVNKKITNNNQSPSSDDDSSFDDFIIAPREKIPPAVTKAIKIAEFSNNQQKEANTPVEKCPKLTKEEALKLTTIKVKLLHIVPPQHKIEQHPGTQSLTQEEKKRFEKYIKMKSGSFTEKEDNIIISNWKKFCKEHNWNENSVYPFTHLKSKGFFFVTGLDNRIRFAQFLAKGLPRRSLYSVFHRFRNIFSTHKQGRFLPDEDAVILTIIGRNEGSEKEHKSNKKFALVATKLNRTRQAVWRRWILLMKNK